MNKSHREIKGETFTERVNPPKPKSVDVDVPKIPERPMFKSILETITSPFRSKPTVDINTYEFEEGNPVIKVELEWWILKIWVVITYMIEKRKFVVKVDLNNNKIFQDSIKV